MHLARLRSCARLFAVLLLAQLCSACLYSMWGYMHDVETSAQPSRLVGAHTSVAGELVIELAHVEGPRPRSAWLVLGAAELDAALAGAPVESSYRLPLPHVPLARARLGAREPAAGASPPGPAVQLLAWVPFARDSQRNQAPEPASAPLAIAWTPRYRTGREEYVEALLVTRTDENGLRRAVFLPESYAPASWDLGLRVLLLGLDLVLLAALLA